MTATAFNLTAVKQMLIHAYNEYDRAFKRSDRDGQMRYDGMISALHRVVEAHDISTGVPNEH